MARYSSRSSNYRRPSSRSNYTPRSIRKREQKTQKTLVRNIIIILVLIYVIFFWGLPNLIGGLSLLHHSSTPAGKSSAASADITLAPPVLNIPFDATNSATLKISGYASPNTKVEIFFDDSLKSTVTSDDSGSFQTDDLPLVLGINNIYGKTQGANNAESLPSKTIQLTYDNSQPTLKVSSPSDNTQIHGGDKKVSVSGNTDPNDTISANGTVIIVNSDGSFSGSIGINDGDNTVTVTATDAVGNTTQVSRKVTYSSS